ncbi:hypothetical protein BC835DRAFT_1412453 [Cytidiella melzeri]|nr:hypothetical protein BC835DRAFT_1412453 [Cytidiella melzeri]
MARHKGKRKLSTSAQVGQPIPLKKTKSGQEDAKSGSSESAPASAGTSKEATSGSGSISAVKPPSKASPQPESKAATEIDSETEDAQKYDSTDSEAEVDEDEVVSVKPRSAQSQATFYLWSDAIDELLDGCPEDPVVRLKSEVLAAWSQLQNYSEEERDEYVDDALGDVGQWLVGLEDGGDETEEAKKLNQLWKAELAKNKRDKSSHAGDDDGWWWQVSMQRDKPTAGTPAMELELSLNPYRKGDPFNGRWWWTGICSVDAEGLRAMSFLGDRLASGAL